MPFWAEVALGAFAWRGGISDWQALGAFFKLWPQCVGGYAGMFFLRALVHTAKGKTAMMGTTEMSKKGAQA